MKIVLFSTPQFCIPILTKLNENFELVGVVTTPDKKSGRNQEENVSPIKEAFKNLNLKNANLLEPVQLDKDFIEKLRELNADLFVVASYGKILPKEVLDLPRLASINVHPSLLPKYRGASPLQSAILNGDSVTGLSIIEMDEKIDHGPILKQFEWEIKADDNFETLSRMLFERAAFELPKLIEELEKGTLTPQAQDEAKASYCKTFTKEDGFVDSQNPIDPLQIKRMIKAFYPWPGVWTKYPLINDNEAIVKFLPHENIQVEGKKPLSYQDFINGYPKGKDLLRKLGLS